MLNFFSVIHDIFICHYMVNNHFKVLYKDKELEWWTLFWDFLILYQIYLSPHVKRSVIISNKYGIYELPDQLPNDLRLRILGN